MENAINLLNQNAHWSLRIALASVFVYHGVLKPLNLEGFAHMLPISYLQAVLLSGRSYCGRLFNEIQIVAHGFAYISFADSIMAAHQGSQA